MRTLKFRAWLHDIGYMETAYFDDGKWVSSDGVFSMKVGENDFIEQYTGLKDKNGKEIYEGDIVRYWSENYEVKFDEIKDSDITYYYLGWAMGELSLYEAASMCEVISNIHENPELMLANKK